MPLMNIEPYKFVTDWETLITNVRIKRSGNTVTLNFSAWTSKANAEGITIPKIYRPPILTAQLIPSRDSNFNITFDRITLNTDGSVALYGSGDVQGIVTYVV